MLVPNLPLVAIMYVSQVINGIVLPVVLVFILLLINDKSIMGDHTNGPLFNAVSWASVVVLTLLCAAMVFAQLFDLGS